MLTLSARHTVIPPWRSLALFASLALASACAPQEQQAGSLGNGTFAYNCVSVSDPACPSLSESPTAFPTIALGGTFSLSYDSNDSSYPVATVVAVSPEYFLSQGSTFTAIRSGDPSFYASLPNGMVLDFTEVTVAPIHSIQVADTTGGFGDGASHTYGATAMGALNDPLAGEVLYVWSTSDPSVLAIVGGQASPSATVTATYGRDGTATLKAVSGPASGTLDVVVSGEP